MKICTSQSPLKWGELDLPLFGISSDWFGKPLAPPLAYSLAVDSENLWFVATRQAAAAVHPDASPGSFTPELWKYDTAELFIADPTSGKYLELNLAPNGAWWAASFSSPRVTSPDQPDFETLITANSDQNQNQWLAALTVPLSFLKETINFGATTKANIAAILNTPEQTFHTVAKLPGPDPDFHQPSAFAPIAPYTPA